MDGNDAFFKKMCREAAEEVANGKAGWREMPTNVVVMACMGMLWNSIVHNISRPMWFFSSAIFVAVLGYLVHLFLG